MDNMTLKIDDESNDLEFDENGIMKAVYGNDTTAQNVRMTLTAWKNDFLPVPQHGTDYKKFFSEDCTEEERKEELRDAIFQEDNITQVNSIDIHSIGERRIKVSFEGTVSDGKIIGMEVNA